LPGIESLAAELYDRRHGLANESNFRRTPVHCDEAPETIKSMG
jgi:hypothetical protein